MSHFKGLVLITEDCSNLDIYDTLEKYNELNIVAPYVDSVVTDYEKASFLDFYNGGEVSAKFHNENAVDDFTNAVRYGYDHPDAFVAYFKEHYNDLWNQFEKEYEKNGERWNDNVWKKNSGGVWEEWSTHNPDSKYDYCGEERSIRTKDGKLVSTCYLDEIDWAKTSIPIALVIDGEWHEESSVGWWGITYNTNSNWKNDFMELINSVDAKTTVATWMDFHI